MQTERTNWLKMDLHVHSKGISRCSRVSCEEIIDQKITQGYDGAVLVNHCQSWYYPEDRHAEYIEDLIAEYTRAAAYANARGFRWLQGIEITIANPVCSDWLLYGVTEEFLRATPCLYRLSQKELFLLCEAHGVVLVQAHPFRTEYDQRLGEGKYLHGLEINCSPNDLRHKDRVLETAQEYGALVTCGTDYHGPERTFIGGTFVPDWVETSVDLAEYFTNTDETRIFFGEESIKVPNFAKKIKKIKKSVKKQLTKWK